MEPSSPLTVNLGAVDLHHSSTCSILLSVQTLEVEKRGTWTGTVIRIADVTVYGHHVNVNMS